MRRTLLVLLCLLAPAPALRAQTILGQLIDATTREPLQAGTVTLLREDTVVARASTDSAGAFVLTAPGRGAYRLRAARMGYTTAVSPPIGVAARDTLEVEFLLSVDAVLLDPVVVTARSRRLSPALERFYARANARAFGSFITRDDIERWHPMFTTDLLRRIPGVRLFDIPGGHDVRMRGSCRPNLFVDGIWIRVYRSIDDLAQPQELEGVEVYRSASEAPVEYGGLKAGCGVVLLWTRVGP